MSDLFDTKKDFSLPIGLFAERLLESGIDHYTRDEAASVQSLLVVFDKYLISPNSLLSIEDNEKARRDFHFKNMGRNYFDLKNELMDTVPDGTDTAEEIRMAREMVDAGQGVPATVPAFGMILSKSLPKSVINACLQVQAGLRILAIADHVPGAEKIIPARIFDNDPAELNIVQGVLNSVHENYLKKTIAGETPDEDVLNSMQFARGVAQTSIGNAADALETEGYDQAMVKIWENIEVTLPYTVQEYARAYYDTLSPPKPGNSLQLKY